MRRDCANVTENYACSPQKMLELQRQNIDQLPSFRGGYNSFVSMDSDPTKPHSRTMMSPPVELLPHLGQGYPQYRPNLSQHMSMLPTPQLANPFPMAPPDPYLYSMTSEIYAQQRQQHQQNLLMSMQVQSSKNIPKSSLRIPAPLDQQYGNYFPSAVMSLKPGIDVSKDTSLFGVSPSFLLNGQGLFKRKPKFNKEERAKVLARYREKRKRRDFRRVRYKLRKKIAHGRPRVGGRFVKKSELAAALSAANKSEKKSESVVSPSKN